MLCEGMENYRRIRKLSLRYAYYMFMDHREYIADSLFIQEKCRVHFLKEYAKPGTQWMMLYVKVAKKDEGRFKAAMGKLRDAALLKGRRDYDQALEAYWRPFMEVGKGAAV